jgi:hypothetical protein
VHDGPLKGRLSDARLGAARLWYSGCYQQVVLNLPLDVRLGPHNREAPSACGRRCRLRTNQDPDTLFIILSLAAAIWPAMERLP